MYFKEIEIKEGITASFSGGGPFHIDEFVVEEGAVLNLGAGTYFVNIKEPSSRPVKSCSMRKQP